MPKIVTLGTKTFQYCFALESLILATESTISGNNTNFFISVFYGVSSLTSTALTIGSANASYVNTSTNMFTPNSSYSYGPFGSITVL